MTSQFSRRQVELILRRTAELERRSSDAGDGALTSDDLARVAADLGMSEAALRQAIAESSAGLLAPDDAPRTLSDRVIGPARVEARRFVPGELASVRAAVERFLDRQGFRMKRHKGDVTLWEPGDMWFRLGRMFRGGPYRLPHDIEIELRVAALPGGPHPILVDLRVDARRLRGARTGAAGAALVASAGIAVGCAIAYPLPTELIAHAGAATAATLGVVGARRSYQRAHARLALALERFLDFLEHEPEKAPAAQRDPLTRLVDFLAGEWWK